MAPGSARVVFLSSAYSRKKEEDGEKEDPGDESGSNLAVRKIKRGKKGLRTSTADYWTRTLKSLPPNFFTSENALMKVESKLKEGVPAYIGLALDERNNEDVKRIYDTVFSTRETLGHTLYTYDQFKSAIGKFARIFISFSLSDGCKLYQRGELYRCVTHLKSV